MKTVEEGDENDKENGETYNRKSMDPNKLTMI